MAPDRRFFLALTVKNEGPTFWEWAARHRAMGFTEIAICQYHSVDGTRKTLRKMEKHAFTQNFNNPNRSNVWQNTAHCRASRPPQYHADEWAMASDCDEFLAIHTGNGTVADLVDALPPEANACTETEYWKTSGINDAQGLAAASRGSETSAEMDRMKQKNRDRIELLYNEGRAANRSVVEEPMQDDYHGGIYEEILAGFPVQSAQIGTGTR